jgi:nucleotide-binding universal stress UspA family protein
MFKRIVVPLDGSLRAERALPVATRLARAGSGEVTLTRIVTVPLLVGRDSAQLPTAEAILVGERETAVRYLKDVSQRPELTDVATQIAVREAAAVAPALQDIIQTVEADLVVICSHGRSGFQRWALGSVAQKIARHATAPTLVLRSDGPALAETHARASALVPLDGSPEAEAALEPAAHLIAALAEPGQGALHLLHVVQVEHTPSAAPEKDDGGQETLRSEAERYLRSVAERFQLGLVVAPLRDVTWSVVFDPDVASAIIAATEGNGDQLDSDDLASAPPFDLIAMASHGRSGFQLWALGSVTERALHASALPLLIVRSDSATTPLDAHGAEEREADSEMSAWPGYEPTPPPAKTPPPTKTPTR